MSDEGFGPVESAHDDSHFGPVEPEHSLPAKVGHYAAMALPIVGGIAGGVSGAAAGPVGAAAGAGLGAGAGKGAQHVIDTALGYEKPIANAEELGSKVADIGKETAETAGTTLAGEGALRLVGKIPGVKQAAQAIPDAMNAMADKLAARMLKGTAGEYRAMGPDRVRQLGRFLMDKGAVTFGTSPETVAARASALPGSTGADLGSAIQALDQTGGKVSKQALAQRFKTLAQDAATQGPGAAPLVAKYEKAAQAVLDDITNSGQPMMSFGEAEKWKQAYQAPINYAKANATPLEMGSKEIASAARQNVEDAAQVAATNPGANQGAADAFLKAKEESGLAQQAAKMAEGAQGRETARNLLGPAAKAVQFGATGAALAHGNIPAAGAALLSGPAYRFIQGRGPSAAAVTLKAGASAAERLLSIASSNPASLGRYGAILSRALQTGGQDAFNAHAYALSQTDPQFQELNRRLAETNQP